MYTREIKNSPESLVENEKIKFGCYDSIVKYPDLIKANIYKIPIPSFIKNIKLKEWEAFQAGNSDYFIFGAVYNAKLASINFISIYDIKAEKKYHYFKYTSPFAQKIGSGVGSSETSCNSGKMKIDIKNRLNDGYLIVESELYSKEFGKASLKIKAFDSSKPMVVVLPFSEKKGMYSHKALLKMEGKLNIGGKEIVFDSKDSFFILDDHKGFYPRNMKYDWTTGAGFIEGKLSAFNFTDNQVINKDTYNENCLWVGEKFYPLPPVKFKRDEKNWYIKDDSGQVDLIFTPRENNEIKFDYIIMKSDYEAPYGTFKGTIKTSDGEIILDDKQFFGMGEKKRIFSIV